MVLESIVGYRMKGKVEPCEGFRGEDKIGCIIYGVDFSGDSQAAKAFAEWAGTKTTKTFLWRSGLVVPLNGDLATSDKMQALLNAYNKKKA